MNAASRYRVLALSAAACLLLAGCGTEDGSTSARQVEPADKASAGTSPQDVLEGFELLKYDYEPVGSVKELVVAASAIVTGTIEGVVQGRSEGSGAYVAKHSAVRVEVEQVEKGNLAVGDDVWLEIRTDPTILSKGLTPGLRVALYLAPAAAGAERQSDASSQVPSGARLWGLAHPQGLIVQYGEEQGIVAPFSEEVEPTDTVEDALPEDAS